MPPVQPMLAKAVKGVPDPAKFDPDGTYGGRGLSFEPKWDGFRCLLFKDGDEVELASRNTKPLTRSEEHTSELQSLMRISYAVFCLKKKNKNKSICEETQ